MTFPAPRSTVVSRADDAATTSVPPSVTKRCWTGWSTVTRSIGWSPVETPPSPMRPRSSVAIRPSSYPMTSWLPVVVDGQRTGAGRRDDRDEGARPEVVGPDLRPGRDVEALAGPLAGDRHVDPARLDRRGPDRDPKVARGGHVVAAPQDDPAGHQVLGEVRMGPLVDVVRQAVAPVLEELGGRPRVVDLVEVHLVGLGQAEGAQQQRADDQEDDEEEVEPVEPAAAFGSQEHAAVRDGSAARSIEP